MVNSLVANTLLAKIYLKKYFCSFKFSYWGLTFVFQNGS